MPLIPPGEEYDMMRRAAQAIARSSSAFSRGLAALSEAFARAAQATGEFRREAERFERSSAVERAMSIGRDAARAGPWRDVFLESVERPPPILPPSVAASWMTPQEHESFIEQMTWRTRLRSQEEERRFAEAFFRTGVWTDPGNPEGDSNGYSRVPDPDRPKPLAPPSPKLPTVTRHA